MCVYLARSSTNFDASESPQIVERYNEKAQDMVDIEKAHKSRLLSRDFVQRDRLNAVLRICGLVTVYHMN